MIGGCGCVIQAVRNAFGSCPGSQGSASAYSWHHEICVDIVARVERVVEQTE
jgi:hypothetical protein